MKELFNKLEKIVDNFNDKEIKELVDYTIEQFGDSFIKHPV